MITKSELLEGLELFYTGKAFCGFYGRKPIRHLFAFRPQQMDEYLGKIPGPGDPYILKRC